MIIEIKSCRTCPCMRIINNLSECRVAMFQSLIRQGVDVSSGGEAVEVKLKIRWDENRGYVGNRVVCRIYAAGKSGYRLAADGLVSSFKLCRNIAEAQSEAQRLFDEWMGGLME